MGRVDVELAFPGLDPTTKARVERTFAALKQRGISPIYVRDRRVALETVLRLIPKGSTVAHGSSTTLQEIGLVDQLKDPASGYRYMNLEWQAESDTTRRVRIRAKLSAEAGFYLGSVQAIAETGEVVGADQSGSRRRSTFTVRRTSSGSRGTTSSYRPSTTRSDGLEKSRCLWRING